MTDIDPRRCTCLSGRTYCTERDCAMNEDPFVDASADDNLRDEILRLRKEVERLTAENAFKDETAKAVVGMKDRATRAESRVEELTAENASLSRDKHVAEARLRVLLTGIWDASDTALAVAREENARLTKALREIENYCPATAEMTAAHMMAQIASEALSQSSAAEGDSPRGEANGGTASK